MSMLKKRIAYLTTSTLLFSSLLGATPSLLASTSSTAITYNFNEATDGWIARGDTLVTVTTTSPGLTIIPEDKCLLVSGRSDNWHGIQKDLMNTLQEGETYTFSVWVKYEEGNATESLSLTLETGLEGNNGYLSIANNSSVVKGQWTQLTGKVTIPDGAKKANVYVEAASKTLSFYMDMLTIEGSFVNTSPGASQGTTTWDFESGLGDWSVRGSGEAVAEISTNTPHTGSQCAVVSGRTQDWNGIQINLTNTVKKGNKYTFEAWVKYDAGENSTEQFVLALQYNSESEKDTQYKWITDAKIKKGEWTKLQGEYTLPKDFTDISLYIQVNGSTIDFYADDITMQGEAPSDISIQKEIPSLKDVYSDYFKFGTAIASQHLNDLEKELVLKHFNSITHENALKPESVLDYNATLAYMTAHNDQTHPQLTLSSDARTTLDFARDHHIPVRVHVVAWHSQTPNWFFTENYSSEKGSPVVSKEIMKQRLENYTHSFFKLLSEEYPTVDFYAIDVVNEAINPDRPDGLRAPATVATTSGDDGNDENANNSMWMTTIGPEFIEDAFTYARAAANKYLPNAKLAYNDYNECDPKKSEIIYNICKNLYDKGLLDVVGMQAHYNMTSPSTSQFENALRKYASIGNHIEIQITELDIMQNDTSKEGLIKQAYRYKSFLDIMKELDSKGIANITSCVVWGVKDDESWRDEQVPLLFDAEYQAKPAFWAITDSSNLPVLAQEVKAYEVTNKDYTHAFLIQNGTPLETTSGNQIANFKVAWDKDYIYVNVIPVKKGETGIVKVFVNDDVVIADLKDNTLVTIPISHVLTEDLIFSFDLFVQTEDEKATWNNFSYDGTSIPNKANFGKLLLNNIPKFATAIKATPTIDGKIDPIWSKAQPITIDTFSVGAAFGATGTAKALWDENYIYVLVEVKDNLLSKASTNSYEQDSVEIFIDEDNAKSASYELGDIQYRVNFDNERSINGVTDVNSFITGSQIIEGGYTVELALPARIAPLKDEQVIGFDLQINDDATGKGKRDYVSNWNDLTGNGWSSTANYGVLQLIKSADTDTSPSEPSIPSVPSDTPSSSSSSGSSSSLTPSFDKLIKEALDNNKAPLLDMSNTSKITINESLLTQLINSTQPLYLKSQDVTTILTSNFLNTNFAHSNILEASIAPLSLKQLGELKMQFAKTEGVSIVGDISHTITLDMKGTTSLDTFIEPLTLCIDLKNTDIADPSGLTLVRYTKQSDGTYKLTKLGGVYNPTNHTLSGYINKPGTYGVVVSKDLTNIYLSVNSSDVTINQLETTIDVAPQIIDGVTMVPLRFISEQLGVTTKWDAPTKTITLNEDSTSLTLTIGKTISNVGTAPIIIQGRTLVPLRYISETLGAHVLWLPTTKGIEIVK